MKKIFLTVALTAFIGGMSTPALAQEGEKKQNTEKTTKTDKKKKGGCCQKKGNKTCKKNKI